MAVLLANNATSKLASSLTAAATTLSVTTGEGAKFPSPTGGDWFPLTLIKSSGALEILRCTARSGDVFTVTRAQEGTAAQVFSAGDRVELRVTAAVLAEQQATAVSAQAAAVSAQAAADGAQAAADRAQATAVGAQATAVGAQATAVGAQATAVGAQATAVGAQATADRALRILTLKKANKLTPCLIKTAARAISVKAGTVAYLESGAVSFGADTAVTMPSLTAGVDYSVWVHPDGTASAVADPITAPAVAPVTGALKIGGFHYGLVAPGTTVAGGAFATSGPGMIWAQADVDKIAGINAWSMWDLQFRPTCDPRGMACVRDDAGRTVIWFDIYFCSQNHIANGTSRSSTNVASGTVLPRKPVMFGGDGTANYTTLTWYEANEIALSHGKRTMSYQEFAAAAFGVTENQSLGGPNVTIPSTARQPGYTSKWGGEQMTGHIYTLGDAAHGVAGASWVIGPNRGQSYGTPYAAFFGGARDGAATSGSRCSVWSIAPWDSSWRIGLRAACDHLNLP